jgi:hypothetical protein
LKNKYYETDTKPQHAHKRIAIIQTTTTYKLEPLMLFKNLFVIALLAILMAGCASSDTKTSGNTSSPQTTSMADNSDFYEVHQDGRIYIFYDAETYKEFVALGETAYRKTFIGAGPNGETLVYGLTRADKKKTSGIPSIDMAERRMVGSKDDFYAEIRTEGRIYVFDDWSEVVSFRKTGEAAYRLTQIGAGPDGETVVFVLTKENKKKRPEALIKKFENFNEA